ncbi:hypothetical protein R1flu_027650 [Riccia fluitans]|uniref:Uncharacterized protein n=1 Tax=Riccia fluitans TaxID=41844 RepID=A0ABD1XJG0_9MARC
MIGSRRNPEILAGIVGRVDTQKTNAWNSITFVTMTPMAPEIVILKDEGLGCEGGGTRTDPACLGSSILPLL